MKQTYSGQMEMSNVLISQLYFTNTFFFLVYCSLTIFLITILVIVKCPRNAFFPTHFRNIKYRGRPFLMRKNSNGPGKKKNNRVFMR